MSGLEYRRAAAHVLPLFGPGVTPGQDGAALRRTAGYGLPLAGVELMSWSYSTTTQAFTTGTAHPFNLPATIGAGDLLIFLAGVKEDISAGPAGWTTLSALAADAAVYALKATGSEDGGTANVQTPINSSAVGIIAHIPAAAWSGDLAHIVVGTAAVATTQTPDPPAVTASLAGKENLFIEFIFGTDDDAGVTSYSTNYVDGVTIASGAGTNAGCMVAMAFRTLTADSDNPGIVTLSQSEATVAQTGVIRPAAETPAPSGDAEGFVYRGRHRLRARKRVFN